MVLAPGLQLNWNGVEGIDYKNLGVGDAHCMYIHEGAIKTWDGVQKFVKEGGKGNKEKGQDDDSDDEGSRLDSFGGGGDGQNLGPIIHAHFLLEYS